MHFKPIVMLLEANEIEYAVGGSLLLYLKGLSVSPNDVDILVEPWQFAIAKEVLQNRAVKSEDKLAQGRFKTKSCTTFTMSDGVQVDLMTGFAVSYANSVFEMPFSAVREQTRAGALPLASMEAWYIMYWLLPGKEDKRSIMEHYFRSCGLKDRHYLQQAFELELPEGASDALRVLLA
ncbi:hypothetical protein [Terribacillus sp. AE2B 122]|uniref:hypothetical protein n=1 Tax=Terribacillus sp. AE2B 122 TaxID=1331902 RepID=UPI0015824276|nr:hypothetical protein [Terribacillus sp. AE2B 122]